MKLDNAVADNFGRMRYIASGEITGGRMQLYIREWRNHRGLTLEALGEMVGKDKNTISRWERGILNLNVVDLDTLAEALVCAPYDLLYRDPQTHIDILKLWAQLKDDDKVTASKLLNALASDLVLTDEHQDNGDLDKGAGSKGLRS